MAGLIHKADANQNKPTVNKQNTNKHTLKNEVDSYSKQQKDWLPIIAAVKLNQNKKGDIYLYRNQTGQYFVSRDDLLRFGLRDIKENITTIGGKHYIDLNQIKGLDVNFDEKSLTLELTAKPENFVPTVIDMSAKRRRKVLKPTANSAFLNYRLAYFGSEGAENSYNLTTEAGLRMYDSLLLSGFSHNKNSSDSNSVRLMSSWTYDWRDDLIRLTLGDFFAYSGDLGTSLNLGGLSYSKRYSIDPYFIQRPRANLAGVISSAAEADVYLDGVHLRNIRLQPGEFELKNINYFGGVRDVRVVIRDAFGREQLIQQDYFFSNIGLRAGLHEYSYNLGATRQDYGLVSNQYGNLATSAFHRYGLSDNLTIGLREESIGSTFNIGPQMIIRSNELGLFSFSTAYSHDDKLGSSSASQLGHQYQQGNFSTRLLLRQFEQNFVTANDAVTMRQQKLNVGIGASYGSQATGFVSINYSYDSQYDGDSYRATNLSYRKNLDNQLSFYANLGHVLQKDSRENSTEDTLFLGVTYTPSVAYSMRASHQQRGDSNTEVVQLNKNVPIGEGWGFRIRDELIESDIAKSNSLNTYIQVNTSSNILSASYLESAGRDQYQLTAAGALEYVAGSVGMSRPIYDSFGLVRVAGLPNVGVRQNNQAIGRTNAKGELFIPNMGSFLENQISLEDKDIPVDYHLKSKEIYVAPSWRAGALIEFDLHRLRAVSGKLKRRIKGAIKPVSYRQLSAVSSNDSSLAPVILVTGKNGEFYLEDLQPGQYTGDIQDETEACTFTLNLPEVSEWFVEIEDVICEPKL